MEHLIAMKLRACQAAFRRNDATDWSDIVELTRRSESLSIDDDDFRKLVVKFGSAELWDKLVSTIKNRIG